MVIAAVLWSLIALAALLVALLLLYKFVFLRDPEREVPLGNSIVAPADGKIIKIMELKGIGELEINKGVIGRIKAMVPKNCREGYLINIMMNIFNVHVQRAPAGARTLTSFLRSPAALPPAHSAVPSAPQWLY